MKRYDDEESIGLMALGRAVLEVLDEMPDYPSNPWDADFVEGDLHFARRLIESLGSKLTHGETGHEWAQHFLCERERRFSDPNKPASASRDDDEVPF